MKDRAFLIFGAPLIEEEDIEEVVSTMRSGWLSTGPKVERFENDFKKYKNAQNAVALNSCTAALHLSLIAAGIKPGDEVITTPMTFCATINAIIHTGAIPVLADIDFKTFNIDPHEVEKKITPRTKAILPVHFAGLPCEMDSICEIANKNNLKIIEDCAHAIEAEYKGHKTGTIGDFGCFSFYVTKNIVTGEGGMVLTRLEGDAKKIKTLGLHGMNKDAWNRFGKEGYKHYQVTDAGFKYNMMDLQAAIGIHQLKHIEKYLEKRQKIWNLYNKNLSDLPITLPYSNFKNIRHAYHLYTILINENETGISRDIFLNEMTKNGIGVGVHYISIPEHPYYQTQYGWKPEDYPMAMRVGRETVSLPISAKLTLKDVDYVIQTVRKIFKF